MLDDRDLYLLCLGRVLTQLRGTRHQVAIARAAGMTQGTLSRFENGTVELGVWRLRKLAAVMGVAPDALMAIADQCLEHARAIRAKLDSDAPAIGIAIAATGHVRPGSVWLPSGTPAPAAADPPSGDAIPTPHVAAGGASWCCDRRDCRAEAVAVIRCHRRGCHADFARCASHGGADGVRRAWRIHARLMAHEAPHVVVK
ncbi:MAG: helix-turn-helix transcriptional regulator [Thermomicrobiales bacterium]|nr:helix-turn-helix transcriptional regulator [Thermomicrobiales bacterium]